VVLGTITSVSDAHRLLVWAGPNTKWGWRQDRLGVSTTGYQRVGGATGAHNYRYGLRAEAVLRLAMLCVSETHL
jgi:hypothetical protein